jgi:hypothetical protein
MFRFVTPKLIVWIALLVVCGTLISCGGSNLSSLPGQPIPNIAGPWEFIASSSNGSVTGIEVALAEGQVLVNGMQEPDGQITASGTQIAFVALDPTTSNVTAFGGNCLPITSVNNLGPGSVTALNAPINFTFTENGNVFNVTGTLSGDGKSILNATYTAQSGNICSDSGGTIMGTVVSKLSGTYTGQMCPPASTSCQSAADFTDNVTATVSESSSSTLTLSLLLSGTDNTNFTLSGPVTGNAFSLQGTFQGQTLTYYGYSEQVYSSTLQTNVPSLYLVNATAAAQPKYVGTLSVPLTAGR